VYYDNPDMLIDFLCCVFDKPIDEARKIYNANTGYAKSYMNSLKMGWNIRNKIIHMVRVIKVW
jgi:hypothetical protein